MGAESNQSSTPNGGGNATTMDKLHGKMVAGIEYPKAAVASYVLSPRSLMGLRVALFLFMLVIAMIGVVRWVLEGETALEDLEYIYMFTHLNMWGLIAYLGFNIWLAQRAFRLGFTADQVISRPMAVLHSLSYTWNCAFHPLVVLVYWLFLRHGFLNSTSILSKTVSFVQHGGTLIVILLEVWLGAMSMNLWGIVPVLIIMVLYTAWAFVYYAISSKWTYSFLDYTKPQAAYMYPGVLIASVLFFFAAYGMHKLRDRLYRSRSLILPAKSAAALQPMV